MDEKDGIGNQEVEWFLNGFLRIKEINFNMKDVFLSCAMSKAKTENLKESGIKIKYGVKMPIVLKNGFNSDLSFYDHGSVMTKNGIKKERIEPYSLDLKQLKELVSFCEKENLDCMIDGDSTYLPGRTICISFKKNVSI